MSLLRDAGAAKSVADAEAVEARIDEVLKRDPEDQVARDALEVLFHKRQIWASKEKLRG